LGEVVAVVSEVVLVVLERVVVELARVVVVVVVVVVVGVGVMVVVVVVGVLLLEDKSDGVIRTGQRTKTGHSGQSGRCGDGTTTHGTRERERETRASERLTRNRISQESQKHKSQMKMNRRFRPN